MNPDLPADKNKLHLSYFLFFCLLGFYILISSPIAGYDTDLWYHLDGGRYILEHGKLPADSYFSFITPPRQWINYYWLFQVIAYKTYLLVGYYGLIFLRSLVFLATISFVLLYLLKGDRHNRLSLYIKIIFAFSFIVLFSRYLLVRPHMFSYLFLIVFIYILEFKPERVFLLPLLAVLWVNLHGVEYPILILVCLSFIAETIITRIRNRTHLTKKEILYIIPALVSILAIYVTPYGVKLLSIPFIPKEYAFMALEELNSFKISDLISFRLINFVPSSQTFFNFILITAFVVFIIRLFRKDMRISHFILFTGGIILLSRSQRFIWEFIILALPVLKYEKILQAGSRHSGMTRKVFSALAVLIMIVSLVFFKDFILHRPAYPFTHKHLPQGVSLFLRHINVGGSVMNYPDNGGYLQWMLYPEYKIFTDLELPFLFKDEDHYTAYFAYHDETVLSKIIQKYNPSFIMVPQRKFDHFQEMIKRHDNYEIVFFDDAEILYVNSRTFPDIAKLYAIKEMKSITLKKISHLNKEKRDALLGNLLGINKIYSGNALANQLIIMLYHHKKDYYKALPFADEIIKNYPEIPIGYILKGELFLELKKYDKAVDYYKSALGKPGNKEKERIYKRLWVCYTNLKQYKKAYFALKKAVNIYLKTTSYKDIYDLSMAAFNAGEKEESLKLLNFANIKAPIDKKR